MKANEDPRLKFARRLWLISWLFYTAFVVVISKVAYGGQMKPYIFGLPAWLIKAELYVPIVFIAILIILIESAVPNIDLE